MTSKRLKTDFEIATALIYEAGFTAAHAAAAMRRFINMLPTVIQVMKNFELNVRKINDR